MTICRTTCKDVYCTCIFLKLQNTGVIREQHHDKCVEAMDDGKLMLQRCIPGKESQKWEINEIYSWKK